MPLLSLFRAYALAALLVPLAHAQAQAQPAAPAPLKPLRVIAFDGGWNLPIWAGLRQGFFEREGLALQLAFTPSSGVLVRGVLEDRHDIAIAAIDNLVAYQEGQGDGPPPREPDLFAFMGGDNGFLSLVAAPGIDGVAGLKGRSIGVDSLNTGFAFVARELLARQGLSERDVNFVRAGATGLRYRDLVAGKLDSTLLRTPFEILAAEKGFKTLATAESLGPYLGSSGFARRAWARQNEAALLGFLRAYKASMDWLAEPANRPVAEALLVAHIRDMSPALAQRAAALLLAERGGLIRDLAVDMKGLETVLALRAKYGEPRKALGEPAKYVDLSFHQKALEKR